MPDEEARDFGPLEKAEPNILLANVDAAWTYPGGGNYRGLLVENDVSAEARRLHPGVRVLSRLKRDFVNPERVAVAAGELGVHREPVAAHDGQQPPIDPHGGLDAEGAHGGLEHGAERFGGVDANDGGFAGAIVEAAAARAASNGRVGNRHHLLALALDGLGRVDDLGELGRRITDGDFERVAQRSQLLTE